MQVCSRTLARVNDLEELDRWCNKLDWDGTKFGLVVSGKSARMRKRGSGPAESRKHDSLSVSRSPLEKKLH